MKRSIATLLIVFFFTPSFSAVFASEQPSGEPFIIPIYFFVDEGGGLLAVAPLSDEFLVWAYTANPHAVTSVGTLSFTYDESGNQITRSDAVSHTFDYNNRLQKITYPATQSTGGDGREGFGIVRYRDELYGYDPSGMRIWLKPYGSATTTYPSPYYNTTGTTGTTTEHIIVNGSAVATVQKVGISSPEIMWNHQDQLQSTTLVTDADANLKENVEYEAFGSIRNRTGTFNEQRKYTGHELDDRIPWTNYTYAKARYLNTDIGRFLSEDPAFLLMGDPSFERKYNRELEEFLKNPQELNSYSYVANNPLRWRDENGEALPFIAVLGYIFLGYSVLDLGIDTYDLKNKVFTYPDQFTQQEKTSAKITVGFDALTLGVGQLNVLNQAETLLLDVSSAAFDVGSQLFDSKTKSTNQGYDSNSRTTEAKPSIGVSISSTYSIQNQLDQIRILLQQIQDQINYLKSKNSNN